MTHDSTTNLNYTFDAENRITGAAGYTYTYDSDGNRVEKSNGSTGTIYWYMTPGIVAESDLQGNITSEYVFFAGARVARKDFSGNTTSVSYYFSDRLETASVITDSAGHIKAESDYYPWGGELQFVSNDSNHYKLTGKERDVESGLDYFGARYYSNGMGRFVTPDWAAKAAAVPYADLSDPQSLNLYSYVRNRPSVAGDPDGHLIEGMDLSLNMLDRRGPLLGATTSGMEASALAAFTGTDEADPPQEDMSAVSTGVATNLGFDSDGALVISQSGSSDSSKPQCFAQMKYRPVDDWRARLRSATHAFWYVQDSTGAQYILTAGPDKETGQYLDMYFPTDVTHDKNNVGATTCFNSGTSSAACAGVDKMVAAAKAWPNGQIIYSYKGPNSNGAANYLGTVGGFSPTKPPGSVGWDKPIPFPKQESPKQPNQ